MTNVISFPNEASMREYLQRAGRIAKAGMHPVQDQLTYGDTWMQVLDARDQHVMFGRIHTLSEVRKAELDHGATRAAADSVVGQTDAALDDGMMYGRAYDRLDPMGELGHTHKSSVWPIDFHTFDAAQAADFVVARMDFGHQLNLQIAWMAQRAWEKEKQARAAKGI